MTEAKQTPKQYVTSIVPNATATKRPDGRYIVGNGSGTLGDSSATAPGAWKNAADELRWLEDKKKQAADFNAAQKPKGVSLAKKPIEVEKPTAIARAISRKEREKRKAKRKEAEAKRRMNRKRAA